MFSKIHVDNPAISDDDPEIHRNDLANNHVGNPPYTSEAVSSKSISTTPIHIDNPTVSDDDPKIHLNNPPSSSKEVNSSSTVPFSPSAIPDHNPSQPIPEFSFTCVYCGCCTCYRETRESAVQTTPASRKPRRTLRPKPFAPRFQYPVPARSLLTLTTRIPSLLSLSLVPPFK